LEAEARSAGMETASGGKLGHFCYFEAIYLVSSCINCRKNQSFSCGQKGFCLFSLFFPRLH